MLSRSLPPSNHPNASINTLPSMLPLLLRAQLILKEVMQLMNHREDKENRSSNVPQMESQQTVQLVSCRKMLSQVEEILGSSVLHHDNNKKPQIKQEQQIALSALLPALKQHLQPHLHNKNHAGKNKQPPLQEKLKECVKLLEALATGAEERFRGKLRGGSEKESCKRSLLTEKIKEAERQESQSQAMLRTIRASPRPSGNLVALQHNKSRDRTVPLKDRNLESILKNQKFSFSQVGSIQEAGGVQISRSGSSRVLLSEMSWSGGSRQRHTRQQGKGCARCQIY